MRGRRQSFRQLVGRLTKQPRPSRQLSPNSGLWGGGNFGSRQRDRFGFRLAISDGTISSRLAPAEKREKVAATGTAAALLTCCPIAE